MRDTDGALLLTGVRRVGLPGPVQVLVRDGRIDRVGPDLRAAAGPTAERVDLDGRVVVPGLWDQHTHMTQWALTRRRLDLSGATSAAAAVAMVAARLRDQPPPAGQALVGAGFRDGLWPDRPTAQALDAVADEVPVVLVSGDLHAAWLSTAGLRRVGADPHGPAVLRERDWMARGGALDTVAPATADAWVDDAARQAARRGVVGVVDYEIADNLAAWRRRVAAGTRALRVRAGVWAPTLDRPVGEGLHSGDTVVGTHGLLQQGSLKVILDGSLNTRTAYCVDPYPATAESADGRSAAAGSADASRGVLSIPPEELRALLTRARVHGITCAVHAIGDAAVTLVLDAFEATGARGTVEHAQLLAWADVPRFAALGLTASVQPEHAVDDRDVAERYWPGRTDRAFALAALHRAGVPLVLGSDAPVAPLDPWAAIAAAVTRTRDGRAPWHPEQCLDLVTALAAAVDGRPLTLAPGGPADLAVLDADPLALVDRDDPVRTSDALRAMPVAATLLAGRWTHRAL